MPVRCCAPPTRQPPPPPSPPRTRLPPGARPAPRLLAADGPDAPPLLHQRYVAGRGDAPRVDVVAPAVGPAAPLVLVLPGDDDSRRAHAAQGRCAVRWARAGFVAIKVYAAPGRASPAAALDAVALGACAGILHAGAYGGDATRVVIAGGALALGLALAAGEPAALGSGLASFVACAPAPRVLIAHIGAPAIFPPGLALVAAPAAARPAPRGRALPVTLITAAAATPAAASAQAMADALHAYDGAVWLRTYGAARAPSLSERWGDGLAFATAALP